MLTFVPVRSMHVLSDLHMIKAEYPMQNAHVWSNIWVALALINNIQPRFFEVILRRNKILKLVADMRNINLLKAKANIKSSRISAVNITVMK